MMEPSFVSFRPEEAESQKSSTEASKSLPDWMEEVTRELRKIGASEKLTEALKEKYFLTQKYPFLFDQEYLSPIMVLKEEVLKIPLEDRRKLGFPDNISDLERREFHSTLNLMSKEDVLSFLQNRKEGRKYTVKGKETLVGETCASHPDDQFLNPETKGFGDRFGVSRRSDWDMHLVTVSGPLVSYHERYYYPEVIADTLTFDREPYADEKGVRAYTSGDSKAKNPEEEWPYYFNVPIEMERITRESFIGEEIKKRYDELCKFEFDPERLRLSGEIATLAVAINDLRAEAKKNPTRREINQTRQRLKEEFGVRVSRGYAARRAILAKSEGIFQKTAQLESEREEKDRQYEEIWSKTKASLGVSDWKELQKIRFAYLDTEKQSKSMFYDILRKKQEEAQQGVKTLMEDFYRGQLIRGY